VTATLPRIAAGVALSLLIARAEGGTPLKVEVDKTHVDLAARKLEVKMNHPAGKVEIKVFGPTGEAPLARDEHDFRGHGAGDPLTVTWPDPGGEVARIDLRAYDADGLWVGLALIPWSVYIPHEEVNFATDSASITNDESPKLEGSLKQITEALRKHRELGPIKLFIAGHTDTVGATGYNLKLSQRRAQSIAGWFRAHGLRLPIFYEGFGEQALLVATPDETNEARNRRVDYILAVEEPALKSTAFRAAWKRIQ
jgi:outer membrane protein OmpA-like peptidoglycan-associated protein